jgi:hypothetical protein
MSTQFYLIIIVGLMTSLGAVTSHANHALRGKSFGPQKSHKTHVRKELIVDLGIMEARPHEISQEDVSGFIPTEYNHINHPFIIRERMMGQTGNPFMPEARDGNFLRDGINGKDQGSLMQTTTDENFIRSRIMAKAGITIMKSEAAQKFIRSQKDNYLVQAAKGLKVESEDENTENESERAPSSKEVSHFNATEVEIEHKFRFDMQALKAQAFITYEGIVDSRLEYRAGENLLRFSIEEQISPNSKIAFTHQKDRFEERQLLQYQLSW